MAEPRKLKILIVEDEEPILKGLVDLFVYHGYEVDSAILSNRLPGSVGFSERLYWSVGQLTRHEETRSKRHQPEDPGRCFAEGKSASRS